MKRKIFLLICCFAIITVLCAAPLTCYAAEEGAADAMSAATEDTAEVIVEGDSLEWVRGLLDRVLEYCAANEDKLLDLAASGVITALLILFKRGNDKSAQDLKADLKLTKRDASSTATSQGAVVGAVNGMIDGFNAMRQSYERYEGIEDDRNRLVGAVMVQNTALLEILSTVYVNNKNLPQGVKDLVVQKVAHTQKLLDDDRALVAIVETVREKINEESDPTGENTEVEETEVPT